LLPIFAEFLAKLAGHNVNGIRAEKADVFEEAVEAR
jgi:hypothetical protein